MIIRSGLCIACGMAACEVNEHLLFQPWYIFLLLISLTAGILVTFAVVINHRNRLIAHRCLIIAFAMHTVMSTCGSVNVVISLGFMIYEMWGKTNTELIASAEFTCSLMVSLINYMGVDVIRDLRKLSKRYLVDEGYNTFEDGWNEITCGVTEVKERWFLGPAYHSYSHEKEAFA